MNAKGNDFPLTCNIITKLASRDGAGVVSNGFQTGHIPNTSQKRYGTARADLFDDCEEIKGKNINISLRNKFCDVAGLKFSKAGHETGHSS
jgi:hypothetical protein